MDHRQLESENEGEMAGFNEPGLVRLMLIKNSDEEETRLFPGIQFFEGTNHETN